MLIALLLSYAFGSSALPATVPTVAANDFTVGRSWTWDYFDSTGALYSSERYTVISQTGDDILIEMSSAYGTATGDSTSDPAPNEQFNVHHRILANVAQCLGAYTNPAQTKPWSIRMFALTNGQWDEYDPGKTLAFEEKFNCNPHIQTSASAPYLTVFSMVDGESVFQQKLWRRLTSSWFSMSGPDMAVAFRKDFDSNPAAPYVFKRRN